MENPYHNLCIRLIGLCKRAIETAEDNPIGSDERNKRNILIGYLKQNIQSYMGEFHELESIESGMDATED